MKRTKEFWARLTPQERSHLVGLERADKHSYGYGGGGYLPDDCSECSYCGNPMIGSGMCLACLDDWNRLVKKAEG